MLHWETRNVCRLSHWKLRIFPQTCLFLLLHCLWPSKLCITCAGHLYVAPCHQTQSMSSNTQLFILGFTAFIEINWHTTLKNKGTLWQILPWNSTGLAAGFQPRGMAVHSLASLPCHGSPLSTTCCQVAGMDAGQENAEKKVRKQWLLGWHTREGLLTRTGLQSFGS